MAKNSFGTDFDPFGLNLIPKNFFSWILPLLQVRNCCKLSFSAISRKTNEPNLRKWKKPSFETNFGPFGLNLGLKNFFHIFDLFYMLDIVARYHFIQFQGKLMNQTWENGRKPTVLAQIWSPPLPPPPKNIL